MSHLINFNFPSSLNIPSTLASTHAVFKHAVPVVQGFIIKLGELLILLSSVPNAQLTLLNIQIYILMCEFHVHIMCTLIMLGILVSLSLMPIKTDIMGCRVCKGNTNCGPIFYADATHKHMVSCWEFSETRSFRRCQSCSVS